jgi:ABC-type bacteriocin/lantibiotic exporter with double-glycine peptidase domain
MPIDKFPDIRQNDEYSCGAAASMSVGQYYGVGPATLNEWKKELGTDVQKSTDPARIVQMFKALDCKVVARTMTVDDLYRFTQQGIPVICPVQDYGPVRSKKAQYNYGHYLTVIDVVVGRYIICQDSSEDNVIKPGSDSVQAPGKIIICTADWMQVWHDRNLYNKPYVNYGIAIQR